MNSLRQNALRARRDMGHDHRATASDLICKRVIESREFYASSMLGCYLPMSDEVDTRDIIETAWRANKRIFVPVLRGRSQMLFCEVLPETELEQNGFGIWEPAHGFLLAPRELDLVITPTVAFDKSGHRIGMGGGYFDRCFSFLRHRRHWIRPKLVGVAFQCQEVEKIVPKPWDIRVYRVITDKK
jgi:5-formyltetrahydrofolate cyclo-ligase